MEKKKWKAMDKPIDRALYSSQNSVPSDLAKSTWLGCGSVRRLTKEKWLTGATSEAANSIWYGLD